MSLKEQGNYGYLRNQEAFGKQGQLYVHIYPDRKTIRMSSFIGPADEHGRLKDAYSATIKQIEGEDRVVFEKNGLNQSENGPVERPSAEDIEFLLESEKHQTNTGMTDEETLSVVQRIKNALSKPLATTAH